MSKKYAGFGETLDNCSVVSKPAEFHLQLSTAKLLQSGYYGNSDNVNRRIYWSIIDRILMIRRDIVNVSLLLDVTKVDKSLYSRNSVEYLHVLDAYCKEVITQVKKIQPQLKSVPLSCDIDRSEQHASTASNRVVIFLTFPSESMGKAIPTKDWFVKFPQWYSTANITGDKQWIKSLERIFCISKIIQIIEFSNDELKHIDLWKQCWGTQITTMNFMDFEYLVNHDE
ncbi:hypothetical protein MN116_008327 [Schistosoma mekongi]|uniref:Uncharacterized protein n=1 Tax=Schistosoma mekongi TaxID=38744 RepID=A0AAE1Z6U0_SCHME|nr:hypothetical protein MN116_008327 [Schistosoma mekongi]